MPGILKETHWSSSSKSLSSSENGISGGTEPSYKDSQYAAVSYPGYSEKPLTEQLEPIAVCGMGTSPQNALEFDLQVLCSMSFARRC
jgi:hypothetical protein